MNQTKGEVACWGITFMSLFLVPVFLFSGCDKTKITNTITDWRAQPYLMTYDGHKFIVTGAGGIIHHPDCKCLKKITTKKEQQ